MAKSDTPFGQLDLSKAYSPPHTPSFAEGKDVNGFDTETADGDIFMLSYAWDGFGAGEETSKDGLEATTLWKYLTHERTRSSLNMWYNLDFDANVFFKHVLDKEQMAQLVVAGRVDTPQYEITYIPSKFLKIKDSNGHTHTHFDAAQFFYTSLDNAAKEWIGEEKLSNSIDVTRFGLSDGTINEYTRDNLRKVKQYARKDARLVRDLWKEAVSVGEDLGIPMGRPFSTGYLAESYLNSELKEKPGMGPKEMSSMAWQAYAGGRFEVIKRGDIGPVAGPDINSAYPYILQGLPDPKTLTWQHKINPSIKTLREADYGFVTANVTTDKNRPIQPFAIKMDDKLTYPSLTNHRVTCVKDIFVNAYDYHYLQDYTIQEAWVGYDTGNAEYPFTFIDSLYNRRKSFEANGETKKGQWLKIVLNSMYGKTCQTTPKRRQVEGQVELSESENHVPNMSLPKLIREGYENGFIEHLEAGAWFNPFIAAYITGLTRLELHKRILEYGLEHDTVMLATDSLMIEQKPFEQSGFAEDLVESGLGSWDYDYRGNAFVVGAGVYQIDFEDDTRKVKTRGFKEADLDKGLRNAAKGTDGNIEIQSMRPRKVAEVIWQNEQVSDIGEFQSLSRDLSPDMDTKRKWPGRTTFATLLQGTEESKPLTLR